MFTTGKLKLNTLQYLILIVLLFFSVGLATAVAAAPSSTELSFQGISPMEVCVSGSYKESCDGVWYYDGCCGAQGTQKQTKMRCAKWYCVNQQWTYQGDAYRYQCNNTCPQ